MGGNGEMTTTDSVRPRDVRNSAGVDEVLQIRRVSPEDVLAVAGSALASLCLTWVLYEKVLPFTGAFGFWLCWYLLFVLIYLAVAGLLWPRLVVRNKIMAVLFSSGGIFACAVVFEQIGYSAIEGLPAVRHLNFWTSTMAFSGPLSPLTNGGILHAAVGSLEQIGLATAASVPLGIAAALFLTEVGGRLERPVRAIVNAMTALPSIVAGLLVYALAILSFGLPECGFAAALAVAIVMLPTVIRAAEVVLRVVPGTLREASFALGASQWRTVWKVVLPTARSGLTTTVVLAMARGIGETAPVLLTAGFTNEMVANPFHGWQATLPTFIITSILDFGQDPKYVARGMGAGLALMLIVLALFTIARLIGGKAPGELSKRQRRRLSTPRIEEP
jgi:phosphate transport system permease protein